MNNAQHQTLHCVFCKEDKPLNAFSSWQIGRAFRNQNKVVVCLNCSPPQQTHRICMVCSERKPLNQFSKRQRKRADKAMCKTCIIEKEEEDIWASD